MNCEHDIEGKFWGKNKLKLLPTDEAFKRLVWVVSNMDNARKKYVNTRVYLVWYFCIAWLNWRRYEGDIENIINDSDTEFLVEDESVISTNIIRKEEISDQSSSVSVAEASMHNFSTENEGEIVGQDEWNSPPITCCYHSTYFQSVSFSCQSAYG